MTVPLLDIQTCRVYVFYHHHHHMSVMQLGHLLTRSGLTYLEVSLEVFHDSFCQMGNSVSLPWVICREAFCLHVCLLCIQYIYSSNVFYAYSIYTVDYIIFIYFWCNENVRDASLVFGTFQSDRTVVVLLHKYIMSILSSFCNAVSIIMNYMYANMSEYNNMVCQQFTSIFKLAFDI